MQPPQSDCCRGDSVNRPQFGAIILAAGLSSRMGENKLLLPWRDGRPIVRHVAAKFVRASLEPVLVVTGRDAELVRAALSDLDVTCIHNPDYATGEMLSSVKTGLRVLPSDLGSRRYRPVVAVFLQPADMPCLPEEVIRQLLSAQEPGWSVAPEYEGTRGHPVLLDRAHWAAMLDLPAGARPRDGLGRLRLVEVDDAGVLLDVDTRESYARLLKSTGFTDRP